MTTPESSKPKPAERQAWIIAYITARTTGAPFWIDTTCRDFVDDYIDFAKCSFGAVNFGAYKCPMLARDLLALCKQRKLRRLAFGISGMSHMGFGKWAWGYTLNNS